VTNLSMSYFSLSVIVWSMILSLFIFGAVTVLPQVALTMCHHILFYIFGSRGEWAVHTSELVGTILLGQPGAAGAGSSS
jgi:hypothetical protein